MSSFNLELKNNLLLDEFIKENILKNNSILNFLNEKMGDKREYYSSFYGNYSYLSLVNQLNDSIEYDADNIVDDILDDNFKIENLLKDLNIFIMEEEEEEKGYQSNILDTWETICSDLIKKLEESFGNSFIITLEKYMEKKLFNANVFKIFIQKKLLRGKEGKEDKYKEYEDLNKSPLFVFDIYKENIKLRELINFNLNLPTLTLDGYSILSSFVYLQTFLHTLPLNKKRNINIMNLYQGNQTNILNVVKKCHELFGYRSKASQLFYQFLNHLEIPLTGTNLKFSDIQSIFNTGILENEIGDISLRKIINTFISITDRKLVEQNIGRFLKAGGEAYRNLVDEEVIVNDIDTKIFFNNPTIDIKNKVYQNIITSLYFIVQKINKENILRIKDQEYNFIFDKKKFLYKIGNESRNEYVTINCYENQYISLVLTLNTMIKQEQELEFVSNLRLNPLDIWLENTAINTLIEPLASENPSGPSVISKEYFIYDLEKSLGGDDIQRIAERIVKGKIEKDKSRIESIKKPKKEIVEEMKTDDKQIKEERLHICEKIMKLFGFNYRKVIEEELFRKIKIIIKKDLDKMLKNSTYFNSICNLIWDKFSLFDPDLHSGYKNIICSCNKPTKEPNCYLSFSQFIKCSFIKLNEDQLNRLLIYLDDKIDLENYDKFFINMILLSTKINELEYSLSQKVFINPIFENIPDFEIEKDLNFFEIHSTITKNDYIYLEWYISDSGQFASFNEKIRNGEELTFVEQIIYHELFRILRKGLIKKGTVLYRGIDIKNGKIRAGNYESCRKGNNIINSSFMSTSLNKFIAFDFLAKDTKCCILKITLTSDIKGGLYLPSIGSGKNNEKEILFLPGTEFTFKESFVDFNNYKIFNFEMNNINREVPLRYISQEQIDKIDDDENNEQEMNQDSEETFKEIPPLDCSYQTKIKFILFFIKTSKDYNPEIVKLTNFIRMLNDRNTSAFAFKRFYEDIFGKMILKYLKIYKQYTYDFDTTLNSILTLEKELGNTSIRQLLNQYISVTNHHLETNNFGTLYKTGGEATRYYTKRDGDQISNDIDSKFCVKPDKGRRNEFIVLRDDKVIQDIFPYITKTIIILAAYIKSLKQSSNLEYGIESILGQKKIGTISVYTDSLSKNLIYNYITVRTNFVGCNTGKDIYGNFSKDCMRIISIDITYKITLINFFAPTEDLVFYVTTAPYDFLIANQTCDNKCIQIRNADTKPPIVSLGFVVKDLLNLFTPAEDGGDLQKRIDSGKHRKDKYRFIALLKTIARPDIPIPKHNILDNSFDKVENTQRIHILTVLKQKINEIKLDIEEGNENLDKECERNNSDCQNLKLLLDNVWKPNIINQELLKKISISEKEILKKSRRLNQILEFEPKKSFRVYLN